MKLLSQMPLDMRLNTTDDFLRRVIHTYNLSDTQIEQLNQPKIKMIQHESIDTIAQFIKNAKQLMICGDYDADGVCSTSIAYMLAKDLGVEKIGYYIPNRFTEGYGVSKNTIKLAYEKGYSDILIVDTGVKAHDAVDYALSLNLNVAIVDHHLIEDTLPSCPILHPDFLGDYGSTMCASGLMFLVCESLNKLSPKITAYAAVGTVADIMPLWGKNREIVKRGLEVLSENKIKNIDALWNRYGNTAYESKTLGFQVIPKINAVGRMADRVNMNTMVKYLLSNDEAEITMYAKQVMRVNDERKKVGQDTFNKAKLLLNDDAVHIVSDASFHEGILGIVANQILNNTDKPTLVLKELDTIFKGSARSSTISLQSLFKQLNPNYFEGFGGHDFAFGMSIKKEKFEAFCKDVQKIVPTLENIQKDTSTIYCDMIITADMIMSLKAYEPFGSGFEVPRFTIGSFNIKSIQAVGTYGYKLIFEDFWLKDAVIFNPNLKEETLLSIKEISGTFDVHPRFGLSFSVDSFSV